MGTGFDCVIPAAGASSRMGEWKPLLPWRGTTLIGAALATVTALGLRPVVVTGHRGEELAAYLAGNSSSWPGLALVHNSAWREGMLGSVRLGASIVGTGAFFVLPADMPAIGAGPFRLLAAAWAAGSQGSEDGAGGGGEGGGGEVLFAACGGRAGHPVLVSSTLIGEMDDLDPGGKLRDFLMGRAWRLVETGDPAVLEDLDTPLDYRAASPD